MPNSNIQQLLSAP